MSDGSALTRLGAAQKRLTLIYDMLTEECQHSVAITERLAVEHGQEVGWELVLDALEYLERMGLVSRGETGWRKG